jgi:hypothetical protein
MDNLETKNICSECPAAAALKHEIENLDKNDSSYRAEINRAERPVALNALNQAATDISCKEIDKTLPQLLETIPGIGTQELIDLVSLCPAFERYVQIRTINLEED